jgi:hypothetical protein
MAIYEKHGQLTYVDESGNEYLLYPKTKQDCVDGLKDTLAGKAPSGYGYGEVPVSLGSTSDDAAFLVKLNEQFNLTTGKTRQVTFSMGGVTYLGTLWKATTGYGTLTANSYTDSETGALLTKIVRNCVSGNWQPWEYENPPLKNNTEYRTTERYGSKPVYVKRINYGKLAASGTTATISLGLTATNLVDFNILITLSSGSQYSFPAFNFSAATAMLTGYFADTKNAFVVRCHTDLSAATAVVTVKYTKD